MPRSAPVNKQPWQFFLSLSFWLSAPRSHQSSLSSSVIDHPHHRFSTFNPPFPSGGHDLTAPVNPPTLNPLAFGARRGAQSGMVTTAGVPPSLLSSLPWPTRRWIAGTAAAGAGVGASLLLSRRGTLTTPVHSVQGLAHHPTARRFHAAVWPSYGITTPVPERQLLGLAQSPFRFETGYALCAKRPPRPFPPPFLSPPSSSFSDPLTTHSLSQDKRLSVRGELVRGLNNGDDAIIVAENFLGVDDGVGAWATKPHGHAALWSRLLLHFWALEIERRVSANATTLDPIEYLQTAYEETIRATTTPTQWLGTTTSATALLHWTRDTDGTQKPLLYVTNLGDCKILVIRPSEDKVLFRTIEQWHWFDCPMQLGTNSVDTPRKDAVLSKVALQENDIVLALSDGVMDNLWEHEVQKIVQDSLKKWDAGHVQAKDQAPSPELSDDRMVYVARELLNAALNIARDPFAESPYMEKAVDEGIAIEGGESNIG
ncbi:uncharacterized protein N7458_011067 [Penicillium daleae]|uniref:Protein phosphatase n=1 Tax=Penicillium daleae TaxID=63821 RepID=A0AAD6G0I2_9EURO|nr:uncharacterized protein N7458_011067 [Penicillium daleae]KAJ5440069.1 hypothetical protein N7458_011067 [Penicillium daleae]